MSIRRTMQFMALACCGTLLFAAEPTRPRIEVFKANRQLLLYDGDQLIKSYQVALGTNPVPPKEREGDRATPEGAYYICEKNPHSRFHFSLAISYPNAEDAKRGLRDGLISRAEHDAIIQATDNCDTPPWKTKLGGEIFVHGNGSSSDWTWGCIALDDSDIEELYGLVPVNTPINIYP